MLEWDDLHNLFEALCQQQQNTNMSFDSVSEVLNQSGLTENAQKPPEMDLSFYFDSVEKEFRSLQRHKSRHDSLNISTFPKGSRRIITTTFIKKLNSEKCQELKRLFCVLDSEQTGQVDFSHFLNGRRFDWPFIEISS